jgi:hypothetical protein
MQVGFGAARLLAGGAAPSSASASPYYLTVWGTTGLALALIVATGRSAVLLRRPAAPASVLRRVTHTAVWCLVGAAPCVALAWFSCWMGLDDLKNWLPDTFIALSVASVAGAAVVVLRLVLALRASLGRRP